MCRQAMKLSRKTKGKTYRLQLQLMAKKSQQTRDDGVIKTACMQRLQKQASPHHPFFGLSFAFCPLLMSAIAQMVAEKELLPGSGPSALVVSSGQQALQICLHTNNISLAKVRLDGESQIKVRKTDFAARERGREFACQAITIETYPQLIVLRQGG